MLTIPFIFPLIEWHFGSYCKEKLQHYFNCNYPFQTDATCHECREAMFKRPEYMYFFCSSSPVQLHGSRSAWYSTLSHANMLKRTHAHLCPSMCAWTHILTSHQCIIIPKQTIINEPCNAYLSERRLLPPPLPLGWGCHSDRFIDIWRERRRGAGLKGWGCGAEVEGGRQRRLGTSLRTLALCLSDVSLCFICQSVVRVSLSSAREQFMNLFSIKPLSGAILALFHEGRDWFLKNTVFAWVP